MNIDRKLKLKIQNGTRSGKRLCDTCAHGQVMKGDADSEEVVRCNFGDFVVPLRVIECTNYQDKSVPQLHEMKAIAWILRTERSGQRIGFVSPQRWRAEKRAKGDFDDDED